MANTHKGVTGRRRPTSKGNSASRRQHTDAVLAFLFDGLAEMKEKSKSKK
ncbi:hypothetical protein HU830_05010 [Lactobacillus sp. DCY120]|uniref:Uncharacterized protein n=1 Tax=Bombilactobacillus apium TaxID=2675299 RepID=A0A850R7M1_9LACO|nr:hypothetical protein [Bombilactobacillus apium]NVY96525.1 hypothetical protein [Bombilactobacillus apium]